MLLSTVSRMPQNSLLSMPNRDDELFAGRIPARAESPQTLEVEMRRVSAPRRDGSVRFTFPALSRGYEIPRGRRLLADRQPRAFPRYPFRRRSGRRSCRVASRCRASISGRMPPTHLKTRPGNREPFVSRLFAPGRKSSPCDRDINECGWLAESYCRVCAGKQAEAVGVEGNQTPRSLV